MLDTAEPLTRAQNARNVLAHLRRFGLKPEPDSRLMRMHDVVQRGYIDFHDPDFWIALESDRDLNQLGFVFEELDAAGSDPEFIRVAKRLLHDTVLPQDALTLSPGRDAQFELYLAASCHKAGMTPVGYDEPDVTCVLDGRPFCVAAKRIKNEKQAAKRIIKAAEQIGAAGRPGIIALEMSIGWNRKNVPVMSPLQNQIFDDLTDIRGNQFFDKHADLAKPGRGVLGIIVFDFRTRLVANTWRQHRSATWMELENSEEDHHLYQIFFDRFIAVMPHPEGISRATDAVESTAH